MLGQLSPGRRKERKISVVLRRSDVAGEHCSGIESLSLTPDGGTLYTASRDACVKKWDTATGQGKQAVCKGSLEGHTDWVNDVAVLGDRVLSCSNDKTVRVWHGDNGGLLRTMNHHSDYVTSLAVSPACPSAHLAASGGLRGELFLIDVAASVCHQLRPPKPALRPIPTPSFPVSPFPPSPSTYAPGSIPPPEDPSVSSSISSQLNKASIYAVALNTAGSMVACGSNDHIVRLWDTRSGEKVGKLRGHTENVRSLLLHPDGSILLSGAADGAIKLWDLCMQRCVQTYNMHTDSVWSLQASDNWSMIYSGGRDKSLYRMHLSTCTAELLVHEEHPVRKMALNENSNTLWVATTSSSAHQWQLPIKPPVPTPNSSTKIFPATRRRSVLTPPHNRIDRPSLETAQDRGSAALSEPCCSTSGLPPICNFKVLNDRRHILTQTSNGHVALWNVLTGAPVKQFGKVNLEAQEKALMEPCAVPSWFSCDVRLGQLAITLEPPGCFSAEEYAQSLGHVGVPDDQKLNLGKLVLDGVFAKWRWSFFNAGTTSAEPMAEDSVPPEHANGNSISVQGQGTLATNTEPVYYSEMCPKYWQNVQPAVMSQSLTGQPWRALMRELDASFVEPDVVPTWVGDVLLRNVSVAPKEKAAFILLPLENSNLPVIPHSRLNAPSILQVHKVADFCCNKLKDQNFIVQFRPAYLHPRPGAPAPEQLNQPMDPSQGPYYLELTCNEVAAPFDMSLASVKKYIWRRSDDPVFVYKLLDPLAPTPMPEFRPPS